MPAFPGFRTSSLERHRPNPPSRRRYSGVVQPDSHGGPMRRLRVASAAAGVCGGRPRCRHRQARHLSRAGRGSNGNCSRSAGRWSGKEHSPLHRRRNGRFGNHGGAQLRRRGIRPPIDRCHAGRSGGAGSIAEQPIAHEIDVLMGGGAARFEQQPPRMDACPCRIAEARLPGHRRRGCRWPRPAGSCSGCSRPGT